MIHTYLFLKESTGFLRESTGDVYLWYLPNNKQSSILPTLLFRRKISREVKCSWSVAFARTHYTVAALTFSNPFWPTRKREVEEGKLVLHLHGFSWKLLMEPLDNMKHLKDTSYKVKPKKKLLKEKPFKQIYFRSNSHFTTGGQLTRQRRPFAWNSSRPHRMYTPHMYTHYSDITKKHTSTSGSVG